MVLLLWFWFFVHPIAPTRFRAPEELFAGVCLFLNPNFLTSEPFFCKEEEGDWSFFFLSGARLRANGRFALPPFVLPPSARGEGSPQGHEWLRCFFLVSSFEHAKEERENSRKIISALSEISSKKKT
ncbi:MAG: hypothetical protein ACYC6S_02475 [Desulfobulbia bacterium]|jgi:hypothetical protein